MPDRERFVRFARPADLRSIPSATGGIARLACARMRDAGKGMSTMLSGTGLTAAQIDDPGLRLEVRTQIKVLDLAAQELQDECLGFHLARGFDLREIGLLYSFQHIGILSLEFHVDKLSRPLL